MTAIPKIILLIILGYFGAISLEALAKRSGSVGAFVMVGGHFVLLGIVLGPFGVDLFAENILEVIAPLFNIGIGWIGLILGLQLDFQALRRFGLSVFRTSVIQSLLSGVMIFIGSMIFIYFWRGNIPTDHFEILPLAFAAIAMMTSPQPIAFLIHQYRLRSTKLEYIYFISNIDSIYAIIAFQVLIGTYHPWRLLLSGIWNGILWMFIALIVGVLLGILSHFFLLFSYSQDDLIAIIIGLLLLSGGVAVSFNFSPLFINLVAGIVLANISPKKELLFRMLSQTERLIFASLLIFIGASWKMIVWREWPLVVIALTLYFISKWFSGIFGGLMALDMVVKKLRLYGLLFLPQGVIALVISVSFMHHFSWQLSTIFQTYVIGLFFLSSITATNLGAFVLRKEKVIQNQRKTD